MSRLAGDAVRGLLEPLGAHEAGGDFEGFVDGNGKANALGADADGDVDTDGFAVDVQQRAARVAGVDAGIALNEVVIFLLVAYLHVAVQGADDAAGHGVLVAVGIADGDDLLAFHQVARGAKVDDRQWLLGVDFDDGQIGFGVVRDEAGDGRLAVGEGDLDIANAFDDVIVGQNVAAGIDDDAGAHAV